MSTDDTLKAAEKKARSREVELENYIKEKKERLLQDINELNELTGKSLGFYEQKGQNRKVPFVQLIYPNIDVMSDHNYLTMKEVNFLFRIGRFLEFGSNVLIEKKVKKTKRDKINQEDSDFSDMASNASITYIASCLGMNRQKLSPIMNSLKEKGVLATADTGMVTENSRICSSRTWLANPNVVYCGDKDQIEMGTQRIFAHSLKYIVDSKGQKVTMPIRLFM